MEEGNPLASIATTGTVGSRFVSQSELDSAKEKREADWKAAYARLGQEPPPRPTDETNDGRSLYERLQTQRTAKQEEWEEKNKLSNQFRALEEDEIHFLDGIMDEKIIKEKRRRDEENEELRNYREAVAQKAAEQSAAPAPTPAAAKPVSKPAMPAPAKSQPKKNQKSLLKGAIVRKPTGSKAGSATSPPAAPKASVSATLPPSKTSASPTKPVSPTKEEKPSSPAKDDHGLGKKRSEAPLVESSADNDEDTQTSKRQKI